MKKFNFIEIKQLEDHWGKGNSINTVVTRNVIYDIDFAFNYSIELEHLKLLETVGKTGKVMGKKKLRLWHILLPDITRPLLL